MRPAASERYHTTLGALRTARGQVRQYSAGTLLNSFGAGVPFEGCNERSYQTRGLAEQTHVSRVCRPTTQKQ